MVISGVPFTVVNKTRLAVQMDSARERFAAIAERQTETLEVTTGHA